MKNRKKEEVIAKQKKIRSKLRKVSTDLQRIKKVVVIKHAKKF